MSVEGVAYLIKLSNINDYGSCSVFPTSDVVELNMCNYGDGTITAVAATTGLFVIGKEDGSLSCFRLGSLDSTSLSFVRELREDSIFDHLSWAVARIPTPSVKDLVSLDIRGRPHLLVLHSNGGLQVWDLLSWSRLYYQYLDGTLPQGEFNNDLSVLPLALLHKPDAEVDGEMISVYAVYFCPLGKLKCVIKPSNRDISVEEGALIDVKIYADRIWILKNNRLVIHNLSGPSENGEYLHITVSEHEQYFGLQESIVAEQLLQNSEHAADSIFWLAHSVYPFAKEQFTTRVSSIFMRMLFLPGIFHDCVLLATFRDLGKHFSNSEFRSLSADGIRKELISLMEHQV